MNNLAGMGSVLTILATVGIVLLTVAVVSWIMQLRRMRKIRGRMAFYYGRWRDVYYTGDVLSVIGEYTRMQEVGVDEITWNDLDLDEVFQRINHTWSFAGEDYLYYLMHVPEVSKADWKEQEDLIRYYQEHEKERIELQMIFAGVGRKYLEGSMQALQYFLRLQNAAGMILKKDLIANSQYKEQLKEDYTRLKRKLGRTTMLKPPDWGNQSLDEILLDYVRLITHFDNILFYRCMRRLNQDIDVVENLITTMGFLESMIAIGSFRKALPYYCIPQFSDAEVLEVRDAYHPLIEEPVANSVKTDKGVLVTGSNASGKSTFLKTIAINAILAQGLHTCAASFYCGSWYHILSSMALRDNLYQGESYYITEIKALKRVLEAGDEETPVLCFVDEVLRGTNTVERIAASTQVLKRFCEKRILCFAATHDIELTYLLERDYENYHFQEQVIDGDILFDYQLYKGRSDSRNAIRLLEILGYEKEIVDNAEMMVAGFLEKGKWGM